MTRSYRPRPRRSTQPIRVTARVRHPAVHDLGFTCFRLVPSSDGLVPLELTQSSARMFALQSRR